MTADGDPHPRTSSSVVITRPAAAGTPSTSKNEPLTQRPSMRRDSPPLDRSKRVTPHAKTPENGSCRSRISSQMALVIWARRPVT